MRMNTYSNLHTRDLHDYPWHAGICNCVYIFMYIYIYAYEYILEYTYRRFTQLSMSRRYMYICVHVHL